MRLTILTAAATFAAMPALADYVTVPSPYPVGETTDALVSAIEGAGANVIARVNHAEAAAGVDLALAPAELVIFGNPMLGTLPQQDDPRVGLVLPLRVLVYQDADGGTQVIYEEVEDMLGDFDVDADAMYLQRMIGALETVTGKAVE